MKSLLPFILVMLLAYLFIGCGETDRGQTPVPIQINQKEPAKTTEKQTTEEDDFNKFYIGTMSFWKEARDCNLENLKQFIEKDPSLTRAADDDGMTPLHFAARKIRVAVVEYLIEKGADVNAKNKNGYTPLCESLHQFESAHVLRTVTTLLDKGADDNVRTKDGNTVLHLSCSNTNSRHAMDLTSLFIERGLDMNALNKKGQTPLHIAAKTGHPEVTALLLSRGVNINARDKDGNSPVKSAELGKGTRQYGNWDLVIKILKQHGAK